MVPDGVNVDKISKVSMRSLKFTLITARIIKITVSLCFHNIFQISNIYDTSVLLYSFNDTAYKIVGSLWGSRNSWLRVTWNANQMSPPNFYFYNLLGKIISS